MPNPGTEPVSVGDIITRLKDDIRFRYRTEFVSFHTAFGRVLARDVVAREDIPRYDVAHMDGYAVSSVDIANASETSPITLKVKGELLLPGNSSNNIKASIGIGEARPVATGGRLPERADTIVPVENVVTMTAATAIMDPCTARDDDNNNDHFKKAKVSHGTEQGRFDQRKRLAELQRVLEKKGANGPGIKVQKPLPRGAFVYHVGSDAQKGELLLQKGSILRAQDAGMLASLKMSRVPGVCNAQGCSHPHRR